jgi:hypothetical protein
VVVALRLSRVCGGPGGEGAMCVRELNHCYYNYTIPSCSTKYMYYWQQSVALTMDQ